MGDPLLVTARLDPDAQERLDALRRRYFPADRLVVGAHLMLFHALPDDPAVLADVAEVAARPPAEVRVTRVRSLGRGVAYDLESPALQAVRADLARRWEHLLTPQDAQRWSPHVTVQNKVTPAAARATLAELAPTFAPWTATAEGLEVWTYRGGPWEARTYAPFRGCVAPVC